VTGDPPLSACTESIDANKTRSAAKEGGNSKGKAASKVNGGANLEMDRFAAITKSKNASIECALANETAVGTYIFNISITWVSQTTELM
jgi:hypothetical protein